MYLQGVKAHIKSSTGRELPFNVPYSAKTTLIKRSLSNWGTITQAFFDSVYDKTSQRLADVVEEHFSRFTHSSLKVDVKNIVINEIERLRKLTLKRLEWNLKLENPPYTQNDVYFSSLIDKYLDKYRRVQRFQARTTVEKAQIRNMIFQLGQLNIVNVTEDAIEALYKPEGSFRYEKELKLMAEVSAYCRIAYKRAIDDVPRIIDHDFLMPLGSDMQTVLRTQLDVLGTEDGEQRARRYLNEDPSVVRQREQLAKRIRLADAVVKKLDEFGSADLDDPLAA